MSEPQLPNRFHPRTLRDAHKGACGRVLLVGGSERMCGAIVLAARAALRSGAGLVELAVPRSRQPVVFLAVPEAISRGLSELEGAIANEAVNELDDAIAASTAVAIGPGMSSDGEASAFVRDACLAIPKPLVVDADGLNAWAGRVDGLRARVAPTILTPHPGEAARLLGVADVASVQSRRGLVARELATRANAIVVLKGPQTIVDDGTTTWVNSSGNSGLATGGSGDVLTGMIVATVAAGLPLFEAVGTAVWAHGRAADRCVLRSSRRGLMPTDVIEELPLVWRELEVEG
ncbi:MAG: NAD(P)H-hydrate dehydratase [Planctomycetes bacterium]|nr:NAD(P)H-hydrate dehydratase [Planctomycetota bacterium]